MDRRTVQQWNWSGAQRRRRRRESGIVENQGLGVRSLTVQAAEGGRRADQGGRWAVYVLPHPRAPWVRNRGVGLR